MNGILVGADQAQEWLLPFWYEQYSKHNNYPICFADFGMSKQALNYCQERGQILTIEQKPVPCCDPAWQTIYGKTVHDARRAWLQKPLACALSPFDITLWSDLDCEILTSLEPLFCKTFDDLLIAQDPHAPWNSGVIVFRKNTPLIHLWARKALTCSYMGDQELLAEIIKESSANITLLDPIYNWPISQGLHPQIAILHWMGQWGKEYIKKHGGLSDKLTEIKAMWERFA